MEVENTREYFGKVLLTHEQITEKAKEIAAQIDKDYAGETVIMLGTLKGSVMWMSEVLKYVTIDARMDFVTCSSYGSSTMSSGIVKVTYEPKTNMYNENVIVVEDIIDTGNTLKFLMDRLGERGPKSLKICTMLNKKARRIADLEADYVGFEIDDLFVIGFGLDYDERFRNLPYVSYLEADDVAKL